MPARKARGRTARFAVSFARVGLACAAALIARSAAAYGPEGHRIAGALASPLLCSAAAAEVAALDNGRSLGEIGVWADTIRGSERFEHTAPWHYMNIEDGRALSTFEHPPEGDVLWAIEQNAERLTHARSRSARLEALRFLVHFIVDVHQPLHVGRAEDRGGNTVDVRYGGTTVNLHRFWDTDVLEIAGLSRAEYEARLEPIVAVLAADEQTPSPETWAAESLALRPWVYDFERPRSGAALLDRDYLERADRLTRLRLAQAAVRLAATLNRVLGCG